MYIYIYINSQSPSAIVQILANGNRKASTIHVINLLIYTSLLDIREIGYKGGAVIHVDRFTLIPGVNIRPDIANYR